MTELSEENRNTIVANLKKGMSINQATDGIEFDPKQVLRQLSASMGADEFQELLCHHIQPNEIAENLIRDGEYCRNQKDFVTLLNRVMRAMDEVRKNAIKNMNQRLADEAGARSTSEGLESDN